MRRTCVERLVRSEVTRVYERDMDITHDIMYSVPFVRAFALRRLLIRPLHPRHGRRLKLASRSCTGISGRRRPGQPWAADPALVVENCPESLSSPAASSPTG